MTLDGGGDLQGRGSPKPVVDNAVLYHTGRQQYVPSEETAHFVATQAALVRFTRSAVLGDPSANRFQSHGQ
jgi:hypothetical protein